MRVSEIRVNQIRVNQGLGVNTLPADETLLFIGGVRKQGM